MTAEERYLFDLNGYLVLKKILPPPVLAAINESIDRLESLSDQEVEARNLARKYQQGSVYAQVVRRRNRAWRTTPATSFPAAAPSRS